VGVRIEQDSGRHQFAAELLDFCVRESHQFQGLLGITFIEAKEAHHTVINATFSISHQVIT
jgi:hypothetical protein